MTVELVIFGCDGVLVDSEPAAVAAVRAALREFGFDPEISARPWRALRQGDVRHRHVEGDRRSRGRSARCAHPYL